MLPRKNTLLNSLPNLNLKRNDSKQQLNIFIERYNDHFLTVSSKLSQKAVSFYCQLIKKLQKKQMLNQDMFDIFNHQKKFTKSHLCAKIFTKNMKAFKCRDCMLEDNSIVCVDCFQKSNHEGHQYEMISLHGGCCDCGDSQKWDEKGFCNIHRQQNNEVKLDQKQTTKFIHNFIFCFQILFSLYEVQKNNPIEKLKKSVSNEYGAILVKYLIKFNENSLISNHMTWSLLVSEVKNQQNNILTKLFDLFYLGDMVNQLCNLYTVMFTISEFKKILTQKFILKYNEYFNNHLFQESTFNSLSCQLFTSHKIIKSLVEQKKIQPIRFHPINIDFEKYAQCFNRFYWDVLYLTKLCRGVGQIYLEYHIMNGNISQLGYYRQPAQVQYATSCDFFGVQKLYLELMSTIIMKVKTNQYVMRKMMKDLYSFCIHHNPDRYKYTVYIPHERALALCIFVYLQGNLEQLMNKQKIEQLLDILGLDKSNWQEPIKIIMSKLNYVLEFEAAVLSNYQDLNHYYSFYSFSYRKGKVTSSALYTLLLILNHIIKFISNQKQNIGNYLSLNQIQVTMPITNQQLSKETQDQEYNRRKRIKLYYMLMGLYVEISSTPIAQIVLRNLFQLTIEKQILTFYQSLLSNYVNLQFKNLKILKQIYLPKDDKYFQQFIKNMTIVANGKINIKQQYYIEYLCSHYIQSTKKLVQKIVGEEPNGLSSNPGLISKKYLNDFIGDNMISKVIQLISNYEQLMTITKKQDQKTIYNQYLFEIIKIKLLMPPQSNFEKYLIKLINNPSSKKIISNKLEHYLQFGKQNNQNNLLELNNHNQIQQTKKLKALEIKNKRILQLKNKQKVVLSKWGLVENSSQQDEHSCIICKASDDNYPLVYLAFLQRTNFMNNTMNFTKNQRIIFSSCYHKMHPQCFKILYGERDYYYCFLCKVAGNILIPLSIKDSNLCYQECFQRIQKINLIIAQHNTVSNQEFIKLNTIDQILYGLSCESIRLGLGFPEIFLKKKREIYWHILNLMIFIIKSNNYSENIISKMKSLNFKITLLINQQKHNQLKLQKIAQLAIYNFIVKALNHHNIIEAPKYPQNQAFNNVLKIVNCITQHSHNILQKNIKFDNEQVSKMYQLPKQLSKLALQVGKCQNCKQVTNLIYICLICRWKGCEGCKALKLRQHAKLDHKQTTAFIKVYSGQVLFLCKKKGWLWPSVYENFVGDTYTGSQCKQKYNLNNENYQIYLNTILLDEIQQSIRYQQIKLNKQMDLFNI